MLRQLKIDFSMSRGHEMTIEGDPGIARSQLDEVEMKMLGSQQIPYLLPVDWLEIDGNMTFRYSLAGTRMLLHRLQQQPLTMNQFYSLILGVTDALLECSHYMLRPEGCLLGDQFIFAGDRIDNIKLAYIPLKEGHSTSRPAEEALLSLAVRWISYVEHLDGNGLKRILQLLGEGRGLLAELREALLDLIAGESGAARQQLVSPAAASQSTIGRNDIREPAPTNNSLHRKAEQAASAPYAAIEASPIIGKAGATRGRETTADDRLNEDDELPYVENTPKGNSADRKKVIAIGLYAIATAAIWRFIYLGSPTTSKLLLCAALSALFLAGTVLYWRSSDKRPQKAVRVDQAPEAADAQRQFPDYRGRRLKLDWTADKTNTTDSLGNRSFPQQAAGREAEKEPSYRQAASLSPFPDATSLPERDGAPFAGEKRREPAAAASSAAMRAAAIAPTVLLGGEIQAPDPYGGHSVHGMQVAGLKRVWNGREEWLELTKERFKIGRSGEAVDYEEQAEGISRIHLELERIADDYFAKDLGSRNGSLLNGKLMVPYKPYKLAAGDVLRLAGETGPSYEWVVKQGHT